MYLKTKFISCLLILVVLISSFSVISFAVDKNYNFDSADFYIDFNKDGSATVTEVWKVTYNLGTYQTFYKNIYLAVPDTEKFQIKFVEVWVDDVQCSLITNTKNPSEYTYALINKQDVLSYEIYAKSEKQTREYRVTYVLQNVVKKVDNKYYWFEYRLLPKGYKENIDDFNIYINIPNGITKYDYRLSWGQTSENESTIHTYVKNVSDLFMIRLKMHGDNSVFNITNPTSHIKAHLLKQSPLEKSIIETIVAGIASHLSTPAILIGIAILILIFLALMNSKKTKKIKQIKEQLNRDPLLVRNTLAYCNSYGFSPADIASMNTYNEYLIYFAYLAELANLNIIQFSTDYQTIIYPETFDGLPEQKLILDILEDCRIRNAAKGYRSENNNHYWYLPFSYIAKNFSEYIAYLKIQGTLQRIINMKIDSVKNHYSKIEQEKFDECLSILEVVANEQHIQMKKSVIEFSTILNEYNYNGLLLLSYCCQDKIAKSNVIRDNSGHITNCAIDLYLTMRIEEWEQKQSNNSHAGYFGGSEGGGSSSGGSSGGGGCGGCGGVR